MSIGKIGDKARREGKKKRMNEEKRRKKSKGNERMNIAYVECQTDLCHAVS